MSATNPNEGPIQYGGIISPDNLERLRAAGKTDDAIADEMAKVSPKLATQLGKIRSAYGGDPAATTAFLNTRFYGDTNYSPTKPTESKGYIGRTLDRIYQSANDFVGPGGTMDQYNQGKITSGQAILRGAGEIYHGATAPVTEGLSTIANTAIDYVPGVKPALQYVGSEIGNSQLGQAAAPMIKQGIQTYNALPQSSGFRDLAAVGQAGLDTLDVLGANQLYNASKAGVKGTYQAVRHPIQTIKGTMGGPALPAGATRELQGPAKEAVKAGMDEKLMTFAAEQNPDTRAVMAKMTEAASQGADVLGGTVQHKEILGGQMMDNLAYVLDEKKHVGQALGAMKKAVASDVFNLTDSYHNLLTELRNKGAVIDDGGQIMSLAGAADDNIPLLQKALDFFSPAEDGTVARTGSQIDQWRQKMFEEMNSARAKLQPSSSGQPAFGFAENVTNSLRRDALVKMAGENKNMIAANDAFEELSTQSSKFLKAINYKGKLDVNAITSKDLKAGEVALRTLGNASSDTRDAFQAIIDTAKKYGRTSNIDEMALVKYADALENVFPITRPRSLQGAVARGTADATGQFTADAVQGGVKKGITNLAADAVINKINVMRGITPENRLKLLMEVLRAPPATKFFTIIQHELPDAAESALKAEAEGLTAGDVAPAAREILNAENAVTAGAAITAPLNH